MQPHCRGQPLLGSEGSPAPAQACATPRRAVCPSPCPCHSSTTANAISASGASSSRTKRAIPTVRPDSWSIAATASRPQQPTLTRCARSLSSRRGFEPRKRSRRERSERPAKTSSTGVRSPARSGLYAIEAIGFRTVERPALFRPTRALAQRVDRGGGDDPFDPARQLRVQGYERVGLQLSERHVLGVVGRGPSQLTRQIPRPAPEHGVAE